MPDFLKLRIEPKESVDNIEAETLQVRLSYEIPGKDDEGEPTTHPGSELVRLDRNARAEARIDPVALNKPVTAILENRQGLEIADLGSVNTSAAANEEAVVLAIPAATIKQALTRLEPDEQPALVRSGRFIRLGKPEQRFDGYALSVDLVDTAAKQNALKALLGLADGAALQTNAKQVPLDATTAGQLGALSLTAADLKFDGSFQIRRPFHPRTEAPGWVWMLNGPELLIGYREDAELRVPQHDLRILLPWQDDDFAGTDGTPSDSTSGSKNPPLDVDEGSLLNEPDLFSDDPGSFCKPFSNPARILGERRFHTVFRVEQPEIESTSNNRPDYSGLLHPKDMIQPMVAMNAMVASPVGGGNVVSPVPTITNLGSGLNRFIPRDNSILRPPSSAVDFLPFPKIPWRNRRQPVGPDNPIDWDGDSTQYQALSVAGGHIMEWRVQWRSNGYSLGDVAHTLTLAPRQTRRIVKLDWRRREQSVRRERTDFGEEVSQTTLSERDYNDAVRSNLNEWSKGGSKSQTTGVAGGIGFAMGPVVIGGGAAHGRASSSSWQQGGRSVAAAEEQSLRDAVRQFGDSLRQFESTVVNEVSQDESIEGVSEVVRNPNYCHSLTVIYHEILRHMRVDTVLAGVRECLFVPFSIRPFTLARIARWQDIFERYLLKPELRWALKYSDEIARSWAGVELPPDGPRKSQYLVSLSGSIYIKLGIERPRDEVMSDEIDDQLKEDGAVGERVTTKVWQTYASILPIPVGQIVARIRSYTASQRDTYFQREIAPAMARRWVDRLTVSASSGPLQGADFTLVGEYGFNRTVRVDFTVPATALQDTRRESIETLILSATEHLPKGSVANVTDANVEFHTDHYHRRVNSSGGTDDLISPPAWDDDESTRPAPTESATLSFTASHWENQNPRRKAEEAIDKILDHVNDNLHYYHKVLWWTMDRDELYMLLDGFAISTSDRRSIASVVEREPIAILGNALVFRVAAGAFLGVNGHKSYEGAFKYYKGEGAPSTPMRVSLPTDGLYAQAIMDQCEACEEHEGSTDWVLNDDDPALAEFPSNFFDSRRSQPQNTTPTDMPDSIINLQNAPAAPAPQGFGDILSTLGSNSAFRDMAGLEGTQKNALGALNSAANLAGQFGGFALQARLAELQAERDAGKNFDKKRAAVDRAVKNGSISKSDGEAALRKEAEQMGQKTAKGVSDRAKSIIDDFGNNRDVTITEQDTDGSRTVTVKKPEPTDSGDDQNKPPQKKEPTAAELDEQRRLEAQAPLYFLEEKRPGVWELVLLNFAVESSKLKPSHEEGLRAASHLMTEDPSLGTYKTEAYTSTTGSAAFNKELAWKRARSALDGIREKGIPDVQIDGTEFSTFRIQPVGEARSLASYLRDNGYPIPDTLPAENPYDRGVVIQLSVYPELRQVDAAAPYWKQPTKDWRMRLLYPKDDTGPDLSIPTSVKDVFNLGRYGEVDFEAYGIYDVNGTRKNGPLIKGSLRGNLIKAVALAKSQRDDWTDWLELTLDHAPMATVEQDWHSAEVSLIGGQLDMFISKFVESNPILRNLVDIEDILEEIRSQYNIPQGGQYVLRILRHMTSFTAPFTFEHIEHERILFVALQVPMPDIVEEWIGGIPPAEFAIASIDAQPFVDN